MVISLLKLWANCNAQMGRINNYCSDGWEWSPGERTSFAIKATINRRQDAQQQLVAVSSDHKRDRKGFGGDEALAGVGNIKLF
jgi:hypothetical protein